MLPDGRSRMPFRGCHACYAPLADRGRALAPIRWRRTWCLGVLLQIPCYGLADRVSVDDDTHRVSPDDMEDIGHQLLDVAEERAAREQGRPGVVGLATAAAAAAQMVLANV